MTSLESAAKTDQNERSIYVNLYEKDGFVSYMP